MKQNNSLIEDYDIKYKTLDMNVPDNLRRFLQLTGLPFRPYKEVQEELSLIILKKIMTKWKTEKKQLQDTALHTIWNLKT